MRGRGSCLHNYPSVAGDLSFIDSAIVTDIDDTFKLLILNSLGFYYCPVTWVVAQASLKVHRLLMECLC